MSDTKTPAPVHPLLEGTTPGPWKATILPRFYLIEGAPEHQHSVRITLVERDPVVLQETWNRQCNDANLIAAAPTLAAENARLRSALEALVQHSTESHMCYPDCVENAREVLVSLTT